MQSKENGNTSNNIEGDAEFLELEDSKAIFKFVKKVKYFWRGINFNYPYTFVKMIPKENDNQGEEIFYKV